MQNNGEKTCEFVASARKADGRALIRSKGEWFYVLKILAEHGYIESTDYKGFIDLLTRANVPEDIFPSKQNLYGMGAGFGNDKNRFPNWKKPEEMRRSTFIHAVEIGEWVEKRLKV
ncbi:MAG: hypothetical protein K5945_07675 [Bacteroidaceae bacterium]|nr:hypothetical protein [Bacteroidaceae bacterium]